LFNLIQPANLIYTTNIPRKCCNKPLELIVKSFGEIAYKWPISEEKKAFIKRSIISNAGAISTIFREGAISADLPRPILVFLQKHLNITGYRLEERPFKEKAIPRVVQSLEKGNERLEKPFWDLYGIACIHYLKTKMKELNELLLNEIPESEIVTSEDYFKHLALHCPKYSVPKEHIAMFNEFWRFDIIEDLTNKIFGDEYKSQIAILKTLENFKKEEMIPIKQEFELICASIEKIESSLSKIPEFEQISFISEELQFKIEEIKIEMENRFSSIPAKIGSQMGSLNKSFEELRLTVIKNKNIQNLQRKSDELEKRIEKLDKKIQTILEKPTVTNEASAKLIELAKLVAFDTDSKHLSEFRKSIKADPDLNLLTDSQIVAFHCFSLMQTPIIIKDQRHLEKWIKLRKDVKIERIYPEPTWTTADELSRKTLGKTSSDCVIIKDFENGIYEAYALPLLNRIVDEIEFPKIIFVSGDYSDSLPSSEILKIAPIFSISHFEWIQKNKISVKSDFEVILKNTENLEFDLAPFPEYISTLTAYSKSVGIEIPPFLLNIGSKFAYHLSKYFEEKEALAISIQVVLKPYISEKFGLELSSSFIRSINLFVGNKMELI